MPLQAINIPKYLTVCSSVHPKLSMHMGVPSLRKELREKLVYFLILFLNHYNFIIPLSSPGLFFDPFSANLVSVFAKTLSFLLHFSVIFRAPTNVRKTSISDIFWTFRYPSLFFWPLAGHLAVLEMPEIEFFGLSFSKNLEFLENFNEFLGKSSKFMTIFAKF